MTKEKTKAKRLAGLVPAEVIEKRIFLIRGHKVMLDTHLAELYGVTTKQFNQQVRRNRKRFPADFLFQLTSRESANLRSHIVTSSRSWGGRRYAPLAFTEQGVAMLSSILHSERAIMVNIAIMRAFVKLREIIASNRELAEKLAKLEKKYNRQFKVVFDAIRQVLDPPPETTRRRIGFVPET